MLTILLASHCIALHKRYYRMYKKSLNVYSLQKHLTKLKKLDKYSHWNQLGSQAIQDIADRIDKAYKLFFRNQKHGIKSGTPNFKKRRNYKSFTLKQAGYKLLEVIELKLETKYSSISNLKTFKVTLKLSQSNVINLVIFISTL